MFFRTALAVAATAASMAIAQDVSFNEFTVTQCATTTVSFNAPAGSYYVAVVPANDACSSDPFADFHDVSSGSIDVLVKIAAGTEIQAYVADENGHEYWSGVMTVGDGDAACLTATDAPSSSPASEPSTSATTSPSAYVVPANNVANNVYRASATPSSASSNSLNDETPANAASNGASSVTASFTLLGGALFAAAALL